MPSAFGVICIIIGCGGLGFTAFLRLEHRVRILSAFTTLAGRLICEIGFRLTPLTELPERLPSLKPFWEAMAYDPYGEESFSESWARVAQKLDLPPIDRALVSEMGEIMGRYDADHQAKALEALRTQLEISLAAAKEKRASSGRLYAMAGVLGGLVVAVVLL